MRKENQGVADGQDVGRDPGKRVMINEKDRGQLLRMAGNIACGLAADIGEISVVDYPQQVKWIAETSARIALETLKAVDEEIAKENGNGGVK